MSDRSVLGTALDIMRRTINIVRVAAGVPPIGEWDTEGPPEDEHPLLPEPAPKVTSHAWQDGWYLGAIRRPSHEGRWGKAIIPRGRVTHTTDMLPSTFDPLIRNWSRDRGRGNGAHFLLGRTPDQGLVQLCPINRNGNHAGGPIVNGKAVCGFIEMGGKRVHPNTLYVGMEVHCAGRLDLVKGQWRACNRVKDAKTGKVTLVPKGEAIPSLDVEVDDKRPERGWHKPTTFQLDQLALLYRDMDPHLKPFPADAKIIPSGEVPAWAVARTLRDVGHISLDPVRKSDPGPQLMAWINRRGTAAPMPAGMP